MTAELQPPPVSLLDPYTGDAVLPLYTTAVTVTGGEAGHGRASGRAVSDDGYLDVHLRLPEGLGGPGGGTNPEQLFAAGYAACFHGAWNLIARQQKIDAGRVEVTTRVTFGRDPADGRYLLTADLEVHAPDMDREQAERLTREAELACPYAKMARQGIAGSVRLA